jgi:hypothetical protein
VGRDDFPQSPLRDWPWSKNADKYFPTVGDGSGLAQSDGLYKEELQLALRNRGMPLEALRYPITAHAYFVRP